MAKIIENKKDMGKDFNECLLSLAEANFAAGDFSRPVKDQVKTRSSVRLGIQTNNIAGVQLPNFTLRGHDDDGDDDSFIGLTAGGQVIAKCKNKFNEYLKSLIIVATLQTQFVTLDEVIQKTNRRVNALEYVLIPRITETITYIEGELEEESREERLRLKRVCDQKNALKKA